MFKNCICSLFPSDPAMYEFAMRTYSGILDMELDMLESLPCEENLDLIFPRAFLSRSPEKAKRILYDLQDIADSIVIRETLPPLLQYALYRILRGHEAFLSDMDSDIYADEKRFLKKICSPEDAEYCYWWIFSISDDFIEQYGDDYLSLEIWEMKFLNMLEHPETAYFDPDALEMLELMPNDIYDRVQNLIAERENRRQPADLFGGIISFKEHVERNIPEIFRSQTKPDEAFCAAFLQTYLTPRGFREAHMAGGRSDLVYPFEEAIVEVKIWRGAQYFEDGVAELAEYMRSQQYAVGYYVIFNHTKGPNSILKEKGTNPFEIILDALHIYCIFINTARPVPSKKNQTERKNSKQQE